MSDFSDIAEPAFAEVRASLETFNLSEAALNIIATRYARLSGALNDIMEQSTDPTAAEVAQMALRGVPA